MDPQHGNSPLNDPPFLGTPQSALNWMYNGDQDMFSTAKTEYINYIVKHPVTPGDLELSKIMKKLGHVLHMFQDMSVPPHVRNDNHSGVLYYNEAHQKWESPGTSSFEDLGLNIANSPDIFLNNIPDIRDDNDLKDFFIKLAYETSTNYFSDDTIPDPYSLPPLRRHFDLPALPNAANGTYDPTTNLIYLPNKSNPLVIAKEVPITLYGQVIYRYQYSLKDPENTISNYYSSQLMPKAIMYSAKVIKYFLSLKGTGEVVIDNPADGTVVYSPSVDISGHLTYYTASATVYYHLASDISREKMEIPVTYDGSQYVFSTSIPLGMGDNKIEAVGFENENVDATSANILVTYMNGGDDHDDNEDEWDDD